MQPTTERMTRARARTLAATGQTPSLAALTDKTPATTRTTRRRAAAAAAAPAETEGAVAPVVLFDVTNEQTGSPAQQPLTARDAPAAAQAAAAAAAPAAEPLAAVIEEAPAEPATAPTAAQEEPVLPASPAPAAAAADEEPAVPASPAPAAAAEEAAAGEPPATPATAPTSPAPPVPGATPTGLGLSTLLPLSPSPPLAFQVQAATPAATPLAGLHEDHQAKVADALAAAVEALGGASPAAAASPAPAAGQGGEPMFRGFGSPLKQEEGDSPALLPPMPAASSGPSVSIGAAIGAADMLMADDAMSSPAPEVGLEAAFERELTLEEMMGTPPGASDRDDTPAAAAAAAPAATPGVRVRTAAKAHPLTPARQVVLEEEQEDYIMQTEEDTEAGAVGPAAVPSPAPTPFPAPAAQPSPAPSTAPGLSPAVLYLAPSAAASPAPAPAVAAAVPTPSPTAQPSPTPEAAAAAEAAAQAQPRIGSKVVLPSPGVYDPRSLRQLKREVADRLAAKQAAVPHPFADDEDEDGDGEYIGTPSGDDLADELGALSLEGGNKLLRGLPTPAGTHIRFDDEGDVAAVSPRQRVYLRGMPQPSGTHVKFDD